MATTDILTSPPPPYTRIPQPTRVVPEITLLLLGSPGVGKSTFISQLSFVRNGGLQKPPVSQADVDSSKVPNPTSFHVSLFARPYKVNIFRSTSTLFIDPFPEKIDCLVICYAVDDRASLYNAQRYWRRMFAERYEAEFGLQVPVLLLGLKRDLRTDKMVKINRSLQDQMPNPLFDQQEEEYICVMPQQGVNAASEMFCDRYAECSAVTGELMFEALEDITRMAAGTTTSTGGFSQGSSCSVM